VDVVVLNKAAGNVVHSGPWFADDEATSSSWRKVRLVTESPIGAGILSPRYTTQRLDQSAVSRAYQTRLDATEVPLPEIPPLPRR
jgi:hypothetical protein